MRDGVLKGDSAIAQAWKELISGEVPAAATATDAVAASPGERGAHTAASLKAATESW